MPGWPNWPKYARSLRTWASVRLRLSPKCLLEMVWRFLRANASNCRRYRLSLRTAGSGMDSGRGTSMQLLAVPAWYRQSVAGGIMASGTGVVTVERRLTCSGDFLTYAPGIGYGSLASHGLCARDGAAPRRGCVTCREATTYAPTDASVWPRRQDA